MTYPRELQKRRSRSTAAHSLPLLASDSGRDGESPQHRSNLFLDLYPQVTGGGLFAKEPAQGRLSEALLDSGMQWWRGKRHNRATSSPAFHHPKWPALLCRAANGGGKDPTGGATDEDGDGAGVGPLAPACQATLERPTPPNGSVTASNGS